MSEVFSIDRIMANASATLESENYNEEENFEALEIMDNGYFTWIGMEGE